MSIKKGEKGLFFFLFGGSKPSAWLSRPGKQTCCSLSPSLLLLNPACGFPASCCSCDMWQRRAIHTLIRWQNHFASTRFPFPVAPNLLHWMRCKGCKNNDQDEPCCWELCTEKQSLVPYGKSPRGQVFCRGAPYTMH